jgi:hypothetical protein
LRKLPASGSQQSKGQVSLHLHSLLRLPSMDTATRQLEQRENILTAVSL